MGGLIFSKYIAQLANFDIKKGFGLFNGNAEYFAI